MEYFYSALGPGRLFPRQRSKHPPGCFQYFSELHRPTDITVFTAMNQSLYTKFRVLFWSENIWIIGPGYPKKTVAWLEKIPPEVKRLIRKVEINFTIVDFKADLEKYSNALAKVLGHFPPPTWRRDLPVRSIVQQYTQELIGPGN